MRKIIGSLFQSLDGGDPGTRRAGGGPDRLCDKSDVNVGRFRRASALLIRKQRLERVEENGCRFTEE